MTIHEAIALSLQAISKRPIREIHVVLFVALAYVLATTQHETLSITFVVGGFVLIAIWMIFWLSLIHFVVTEAFSQQKQRNRTNERSHRS